LYPRLEASCAVVEPFLDVDAPRAAELLLFANRQTKAQLSLGDSLCIAVAERLQLPLVGNDGLWTQLPLEVDFHQFR
jgi:PIN domain nuclease of toxin-antitoxin system